MALLELPDELLLEIFKHLFVPPPPITPSEDSNKRHRPDGAALPKVSRRVRRLATRYLYTHVDLNFNDFPSAAALLHRTLSEDPELRPYCRSLRLIFLDPDLETPNGLTGDERAAAVQSVMDRATEVIGWLTNAKSLYISAYFTHPKTDATMWSLVGNACRNMPQLETLSLGKSVWLERACELLGEVKQLRTLEIGIGVVSEDLASPAPELVGSSPVTSLSIDYLLARPGNLNQLLLLPANLEHFAFKGLHRGCYWSWPLSQMFSALEPHQNSLRTLHVASARASGEITDDSLEDQVEGLDWSAFTKLEGITFLAAPA